MDNDLIFQIALTNVPYIGDVHAKALMQHFGSAERVFKAKMHELEGLEGMGKARASSIKKFTDFETAEKEIVFIEKYKVTPLSVLEKNYPQRLLNAYDCPSLLFYKGVADLNAPRIISIVGTRSHSDYGRQVTEQLIEDLKDEEVVIVSGLAFGIDTIAHRSSVNNNIPTIGVLGHGLDVVYPSQNRSLARQMLENGGLLTEFPSRTKPDRQNFPLRNRIVAGISDAVIVVETGIRGGSLITAELGVGYNKDVFAFPGRVTDDKSEGCNFLIKSNRAALITGVQDLLDNMGWSKAPVKKKKQKELFIDLPPDEQLIYNILREREQIHVDELYLLGNISSSRVAAALLMLEMENIIESLPGKMYRLH